MAGSGALESVERARFFVAVLYRFATSRAMRLSFGRRCLPLLLTRVGGAGGVSHRGTD